MFGLFAVIKTTSLIKSDVFGELLYLFNHYQLLIHSDQPVDISFITCKVSAYSPPAHLPFWLALFDDYTLPEYKTETWLLWHHLLYFSFWSLNIHTLAATRVVSGLC